MQQTGTNLFRVKAYNEARVLEIIRTRGSISRPDIAEASGLKFQSVSNITNRLREVGVVQEEDGAANSGRRRSVMLRLNERAAFAVGIQLSRSVAWVVATDFAGTVISRSSADVAVSDGPRAVVPALCETVGEVIEGAGLFGEGVLGVGIATPGPPSPKTGRMLDPELAAWSDFPLKQELERQLGLPVYTDNDATAAALGERWGGVAKDASDFVYVYLGSGVGAGVFMNHQVCRGSNGSCGEIGHLSVNPEGPPCYCGRRGCLEVYASPQGILREARVAALQCAHLPLESRPAPPETLEEVIEGENPVFQSVVEACSERLGRTIVQVTDMLDPGLIVLGGPTTELLGDVFKEAVISVVQNSALPGRPAPDVELSSLGADAGPVGAATLVLHDLYAPGLQRLSLA